jgi:hypothetical protein
MKNLLIACIFIATACNKNDVAKISSINGSWTMIKASHEFTAQTFTKPSGLRDVVIEFNGNADGGNLSGTTSVNIITPSIYKLGHEHSILIPSFSHTKIYEPQWGSLLLNNLSTTTHYQLSEPTHLTIFTHEYMLEFKRN